jgi:hypothetical protein
MTSIFEVPDLAGQALRFVPVGPGRREGIVEVGVSADPAGAAPAVADIGGVRFVTQPGGAP